MAIVLRLGLEGLPGANTQACWTSSKPQKSLIILTTRPNVIKVFVDAYYECSYEIKVSVPSRPLQIGLKSLGKARSLF